MTFSTDHYVKRYFEAVNSQIISDKNDPVFSVQIPIDVDKELTNRPYYWMYIESLGQTPEPTTLNFIFDSKIDPPDDIDCELITLGSIRFHNILNSARKRGRVGKLYQYFPPKSQLSRSTQRPYLLLNMRVSLIADKTKDHLYSLGINLQNGQLYRNFYNNVKMFPLSEVPPHERLLEQPKISLEKAIMMMETDLCDYIIETDNQWAIQAKQNMDSEIQQINLYYDSQLADLQTKIASPIKQNDSTDNYDARRQLEMEIDSLRFEKKQRIDEINWQFSPRVEISPYSMMMIYMV